MLASFGWGTLAASSLVIGALVALRFRIGLRAIGLIMGFGAGVLISALSFDLVDEAIAKSSGDGWVAAGFFAGCGVFFGGDHLIDRGPMISCRDEPRNAYATVGSSRAYRPVSAGRPASSA